MRFQIPVAQVVHGHGIPTVCVRHGRPQTRRHPMGIVSQAPGWTYALIIAGWFPFWVARAATKKTIAAKAWPFCERCVTQRWIALVATSLVTAAGVAMAVAGLAFIDEHLPWPFWAAVGGILLMVTGLGASRWAQWAGVARAVVDSDLVWVNVRNPHEGFEDAARQQAS